MQEGVDEEGASWEQRRDITANASMDSRPLPRPLYPERENVPLGGEAESIESLSEEISRAVGALSDPIFMPGMESLASATDSTQQFVQNPYRNKRSPIDVLAPSTTPAPRVGIAELMSSMLDSLDNDPVLRSATISSISRSAAAPPVPAAAPPVPAAAPPTARSRDPARPVAPAGAHRARGGGRRAGRPHPLV